MWAAAAFSGPQRPVGRPSRSYRRQPLQDAHYPQQGSRRLQCPDLDGYDTLGLEDVEFTDGVGISGNFMSQELEVDVPGVGDISEMASGTYNPASMFRENKAKGSFSNMELGLQLTGLLRGGNPLQQHQWKMGSLYKGRRL